MTASRLAKKLIPSPAVLQKIPGLGWLGRYFENRPWLWVAHRRRVALGASLGVGFGVLPIPSQMLLAGAAAVALRANVGAAVAATWLTNPFTLVPIWSLAIWLGNLVLPGPDQVAVVQELSLSWGDPAGWGAAIWNWVLSLGKPLLVGLPLAGLVLGAATYLTVHVAWTVLIRMERQRRLRKRC